jgi:hypothetical protein
LASMSLCKLFGVKLCTIIVAGCVDRRKSMRQGRGHTRLHRLREVLTQPNWQGRLTETDLMALTPLI